MYCNQCGNILQDGAVFCSFCGAKHNAEQPARPINAPQTAQEAQPVSVPVYGEAAPVIQPADDTGHNEPPQASFSTESDIPRMAPNFGTAVPVKKEKPPKAERYYTFGHIMLCLSAVALMAIVAGVFAGLYFTAI